MPINYYPNLTAADNQPSGEDQLVALLESLQRRATLGQVSMTSAGGDQQMRTFQGSTSVRSEIRNVLYSLFLVDSDKYANPYSQRIRRVGARYF